MSSVFLLDIQNEVRLLRNMLAEHLPVATVECMSLEEAIVPMVECAVGIDPGGDQTAISVLVEMRIPTERAGMIATSITNRIGNTCRGPLTRHVDLSTVRSFVDLDHVGNVRLTTTPLPQPTIAERLSAELQSSIDAGDYYPERQRRLLGLP